MACRKLAVAHPLLLLRCCPRSPALARRWFNQGGLRLSSLGNKSETPFQTKNNKKKHVPMG